MKNNFTRALSTGNIVMLMVLAAFAVAGFSFFAHAKPAQQLHYNVLAEAPTKTHSEVSSVDSSGVVEPAQDVFDSHGNPKVSVRVDGSTSGGTCVVALYRWHKAESGGTTTWTFLGKTHSATLTLDDRIETAGDGSGEGALSRYGLLTDVEFDTRGAPYYEIRLDTLSGGNANIWAWSYGARSE